MKSDDEQLHLRGSRVGRERAAAAKTHPEAPPTAPEPPSWLCKDARAIWAEQADTLHQAGLLSDCDTLAFGMLCEVMAQYIALRELVAEEGYTVVREHYSGPHPCLKPMAECSAMVRRLTQDMGLSPKSRQGLKLSPPQKKAGVISPFAKG